MAPPRSTAGTGGDDIANSVATDSSGNIYIAGYTSGNLGATNAGSPDAYVAKYDPDGNRVWLRQFGTPQAEVSIGVTTDSMGNVLLTGWTAGSLDGAHPQGSEDGFAAGYDSAGNALWIQQFGTRGTESATGISTDNLGNVYVSAYTDSIIGSTNAGQYDGVLVKIAHVPVPKSSALAVFGLIILNSRLMRPRISA